MAKKNKSGGSLRDQLKAAGLVTAKQARKAEKGALRNEVRVKKGIDVDNARQEAEQMIRKKAEEDRLANKRLNEESEQRALLAQVKQLAESNSQREPGDVPYNFTENKKIKKIYISEANKTQLNKGYLAIVKSGDAYELVPEVVARRIESRSPESVLFIYDKADDVVDEDDPYKDYPIPDDLEW